MLQDTANASPTISFACSGCGKRFAVPASYAGRKANCKACGSPITVPSATARPESDEKRTSTPTPVVPSAPPARSSATESGAPTATLQRSGPSPAVSAPAASSAPKLPVRTRRLLAEAEQMRRAFADSTLIRLLSAQGNPPEIYRIEYRVKGLRRGWFGRPRMVDEHRVEIRLTSDYPRLSPQCKMLTPIFHPNIDPATICVGDHWTAGERLVDLVIRIGEMLAYQAYNIKSPLDGQAAMWADLHANRLPIDARNLHPAEQTSE